MLPFPLKAGQNIVQKTERLEKFMEVLLAGLRFESLRHNCFHDLQVAVPEAPKLLGRSDHRLSSIFFLDRCGGAPARKVV